MYAFDDVWNDRLIRIIYFHNLEQNFLNERVSLDSTIISSGIDYVIWPDKCVRCTCVLCLDYWLNFTKVINLFCVKIMDCFGVGN